MKTKLKICAATPLICVVIFLVLGFAPAFGLGDKPLWHPGWVVFFLVPIMPCILGIKKFRIGYPIICVLLYLVMGFVFNLWHPGWIIFLTIPIVGIFVNPKRPNNHVSYDYSDDKDDQLN